MFSKRDRKVEGIPVALFSEIDVSQAILVCIDYAETNSGSFSSHPQSCAHRQSRLSRTRRSIATRLIFLLLDLLCDVHHLDEFGANTPSIIFLLVPTFEKNEGNGKYKKSRPQGWIRSSMNPGWKPQPHVLTWQNSRGTSTALEAASDRQDVCQPSGPTHCGPSPREALTLGFFPRNTEGPSPRASSTTDTLKHDINTLGTHAIRTTSHHSPTAAYQQYNWYGRFLDSTLSAKTSLINHGRSRYEARCGHHSCRRRARPGTRHN